MLIEGDPLSLRRLVVNLVDNALKYGKRARLRLRVGPDYCNIEIDDDGPGIPEGCRNAFSNHFSGPRPRGTAIRAALVWD